MNITDDAMEGWANVAPPADRCRGRVLLSSPSSNATLRFPEMAAPFAGGRFGGTMEVQMARATAAAVEAEIALVAAAADIMARMADHRAAIVLARSSGMMGLCALESGTLGDHLAPETPAAEIRTGLGSLYEEVAGLRPGWDGPGSLAPTRAVTEAFLRVLQCLPKATRDPEVDVDSSTGAISLRWFSGDGKSVFSLTCARGDEVVGVLTREGRSPVTWRELSGNAQDLRRRLAEVALLAHDV